MARSMLKGKGIPNLYWAEAIHTTIYILNRSPTKAVRNKTPYEAWYKKKSGIDHFRIFGSIAYALIPSQHREKFDQKKLLFIGYSDEIHQQTNLLYLEMLSLMKMLLGIGKEKKLTTLDH
ncbi:hypothetical protein ZIOFF_067800 [Zingiber officinale]|uniref:Uncharacterized protein n=1 Tax=Zingiber officinale TaxID=94328 RepID=A0A8J5ERC8_ZINOF|nr:hypothetical protein ZIOFF_067800 [Zingiber officinale]